MSQTLPSLTAATSPLNTASLLLIDDANEANPTLTSKKATLAQVITATTTAIAAAGINNTAIGTSTPSTVRATTLTLSPFILNPVSGTVLRLSGTAASNTLQLFDGTNAYGLALYEGNNPRVSLLSTAASSFFYGINATPIGAGSPSTGAFTTLTTSSTIIASGTIAASNFSGSSSGTNTGDQTTISGNAATATALQNSRTIGGSSFNGTANVTSFPTPGAIGGTTPSTGAFTTLSASGALTASGGLLFTGGGGINGVSGAVTLTAAGTNQAVSLNTSGTGEVLTNAAIRITVASDPAIKFWTGASERATTGWSGGGSYVFYYSSAQSGDIWRAYANYTVLSPIAQRTVIGTNTDDGATKLQIRGGVTKLFDVTESSGLGVGSLVNLGGFSNAKNFHNGGNIVSTGTVTGSNLSGTNTGDQTNISGNAATATALQTARTINGVSFNGTANITLPSTAPVGVRTRAALRAYTGMIDGQFLTEQGYGFEGDGGGGVWVFESSDSYSVDNDGTLIVPGGVLGTPATSGCWHRVGAGTKGSSEVTGTKLDIRWFGAIPDKSTDCGAPLTNAFNALKVGSAKLNGCLYAPAGYYVFRTNVTLDVTGLDIKTSLIGDGPGGTVFISALLTGGLDHLFKFIGFDSLTLDGFTVQRINVGGGTYDPANIFYIKEGQSIHMNGVDGRDNVGTFIFSEATAGGSWIQLANCKTYGSSNVGTQLSIQGGAGVVTGCSFKTSLSTPCLWVKSCNSLQVADSFFEGGGPWKSFSSTITSTVSTFTINATAHGFSTGDYILITGSSVAGYNGIWKVAGTGANQVIISSAINLGNASATLSTLWSCALLGGYYGGLVTESSIDNCLFNTGGSPGTGSVGMWFDGRQSNSVVGIKVSQCTFDYGTTAMFAHGVTYQAANVLSGPVWGSNVGGLYISNCAPNGGPRDTFGAFRLEGVSEITLDNCSCFPGDNAPPGTGKTFNSLVVSDGGQTYYTQDITIIGGSYTVPHSSELYPSASIYAFVFDGANVRRVYISGVGVDTTSSNAYVSSFVNSASASNGISVVYSDSGGATYIGNADIRSGNAIMGIVQTSQMKLVPELGYPTGGSIPISFGGNTSIYIPLGSNPTFSTTGLASGTYIFLALKNTTGGSLSLTWPGGWTWAGVSAPTSLASGAALLVRAFAFGVSDSDVIATY